MSFSKHLVLNTRTIIYLNRPIRTFLLHTFIKHKTIFISPLDWGLGHATRCVPLIRQLMADNTLILGTTPTTEAIFREEFPQLKTVGIEPYNIRYSRSLPLMVKLLSDSPRILSVIKKEHEQLKSIVKEHAVDLIISDNRFGLHHNQVESIYISHQLKIKAGIWSAAANRIHHRYIRCFKQVWVPDFEDRNLALAGSLSENPGLGDVRYIGPLSRLDAGTPSGGKIDYLLMLSGAEPQRSMLEEALCRALGQLSAKIILVRGTAQKPGLPIPEHIQTIDLADAARLSQLIRDAETVVCRSGYSSLMDLHHFGKKRLILIPTPGQPEQEYLAQHWQNRFGATVLNQNHINRWKP